LQPRFSDARLLEVFDTDSGECRQVIIALVVTPESFPIGYEILPGNTLDKTTLRMFLKKAESMYGKARRVWIMDRGIPTEDVLSQVRLDNISYLVGTPRDMLTKLEDKLGSIMMIDVRIPTTDGRILEMRRYSQPEPEHQIILDMLHLNLPKQPPPEVYLPASDQLTDTICGGN